MIASEGQKQIVHKTTHQFFVSTFYQEILVYWMQKNSLDKEKNGASWKDVTVEFKLFTC